MAFTRTQLAKYDGKNGNPAYVAYQGRVWDVSNVFVNGEYNGLHAGTDLTNNLGIQDEDPMFQKGIIVGGISDQ